MAAPLHPEAAGLAAALLFLISSNRFAPAWTAYPSLLTQEALLCLSVDAHALTTMRAATDASMRALRRARSAPP